MQIARKTHFFAALVITLICLTANALASQDAVKPKSTGSAGAGKKPETKTDKPAATEGDKSGAKEVTYLDLVHAREKSLKLKDDNMRDIQLLNALGNSLPEAIDKGESEKISTEYKDALKLIYKMEYVGAEKTLRTNRENIAAAMGKASEIFRKKTTEMLNQSADRMADLDMQAENTGSADSIRMAGIVQKNQHRLTVGYQQLTQASNAEKHRRYAEALAHYRLARLHSIYLKIELAKDDNEKKQLRAQYRNEIDEKHIGKDDKKESGGPKPTGK